MICIHAASPRQPSAPRLLRTSPSAPLLHLPGPTRPLPPVFNVTVSVREVTPEGDEVIRVGKLYLVDLAGSENITRWAGGGGGNGNVFMSVGWINEGM